MSFHLSAQDINLEDGHILHAQLTNVDGESVDSQLDLNAYIGNNNGAFEWGGEGFSNSAHDVSFDLEGDDSVPILRATLGNLDGEGVSSDLNLSECLANDNGQLVFVPPE
ncbi:hypothetical protein G7046_g4227 [Stylonectria norvegica]|nr:hypothetical protein G7046_g4227 [Stylonectria norvegica]